MTKPMNHWRRLCRTYDDVISEITDTLTKHGVNPDDGEEILMLLAGMSAGIRSKPIVNTNFVDAIGVGWQMGAEDGGGL